MSEELQTKTCPFSSCSFSYCFWAKLIVAIPALPLAAFLAASQFDSPVAQTIAASVTVGALVYAAVKIDRMPVFSGKVVKRDCGK
jgi:hypothetical protein